MSVSRFALELGPELIPEFGDGVLRGRVTIGEFSEGFATSICHWSARDYLEQWVRAAACLAAGGEAATFVTNMVDPAVAEARAMLWTCYRVDGGEVAFRNTFAAISDFVSEPETRIALRPEHWIPPRDAHAEGGLRVSEWTLDGADLSIDLRIVFPTVRVPWPASALR